MKSLAGTRPGLAGAVRSYNLFGEESDLPDVVHCETIAARSVLHDWELAPHRHARLHQILLVERGGGRAAIEGEVRDLGPMRAVNVPMGTIHSFSFTPGTQGWVVTLAAEMLDAALDSDGALRRMLGRAAVFEADAALREIVTRLFAEYDGRDVARAQMLRALSGELLCLAARALPVQSNAAAAPAMRRAEAILRRFEDLLDAHYRARWSVADYADRLGITPVHLSRIARAQTGRPASALIDERLVREARRNLIYTNLSVGTIAETLGFDDPAYFSRVFTRVAGMPPRRFRDLAAGQRS